jgi:hypothetical protein
MNTLDTIGKSEYVYKFGAFTRKALLAILMRALAFGLCRFEEIDNAAAAN